MTFRNWRIGIHIQQDSVAIVALLYERGRWALRRWWRIPLPPGLVAQGSIVDLNEMVKRLREWRRELPLQHQVCIALPASRTLQKQLPAPQVSLRESERATWIAGTMARQLEMPASSLCIDYAARAANDGWQATAAQRLDIDALRQLARRLKLRLAAIVPDAAALTSFFPWLADATQGLVWQGDAQWLWATQERWGYCPCAEAPSFSHLTSRLNDEQFQLCSSLPLAENSFDCWSVIHRLQPPLPACGDRFAIALGLALGGK
ncbi:TPA: pilus assembly protein PilM [Klebsiella aerogenes]|jgi:pilus assembly protein HofM|uniref:pilus assembly protein PilM n=1 Tax=Klebsiella TaxID=570 RepID=UPI0006512889|nr:pilus assembly protein PilM [Klebsiella aerogenes]EIV2483827.1 pilus assembly protein PilM [Klebsiella aerogenes]EIV6850870.1 pilus assembly protein PilM [Klebsiella aerogenes]EJL5447596.1 pilus assembly protein PilM [Klebsiella aerogenes]EKT8946843.1 pilus assembly protein PilM [Klebsiella aerogenes]EKV8597049.1 pilus assembly protein PilM [Klebsiella aerogenes]